MSIGLNPIEDRIVARRQEAETVSAGGIITPNAQASNIIEVLAVGPGRCTSEGRLIEPRVKVGDKLLIGKFGGEEVELKGEKYLILREGEALAIYEG